MKKEIFSIQGKVWKYSGPAGWYFVYVPKKESEGIKKKSLVTVGFGFVPVQVTVGESTWKTTLFPTKEGPYLLSIKANIRKLESIYEGDEISVKFMLS